MSHTFVRELQLVLKRLALDRGQFHFILEVVVLWQAVIGDTVSSLLGWHVEIDIDSFHYFSGLGHHRSLYLHLGHEALFPCRVNIGMFT